MHHREIKLLLLNIYCLASRFFLTPATTGIDPMSQDGNFRKFSKLDSIITGCNDGQIVIWEITPSWQIYPRHMLFGHTASICCLSLGSEQQGYPYVVSSSENGEMCLWDISDGRCLESSRLPIVHTRIQPYRFNNSNDIHLVCNGYYPEIHIMDPFGFEILFSLHSKVTPDWISACCILKPVKGEDDVVVAVSNSGAVKVWSLSGEETKIPFQNTEKKTKSTNNTSSEQTRCEVNDAQTSTGEKLRTCEMAGGYSRYKPIYEDESKQIRCLNAQTLRCCPYNQRTVLIVCSKYWQVSVLILLKLTVCRYRSPFSTHSVYYSIVDHC
ncbi:WD repeat-containing protein 7 [Acanthosepion pharaonis]|uniref:WD repeat-containing protein 7 n=1 Tax=Acanthosepion pharaonis TaxID=158019 RepID=A0A812B4Y0_ACAPH|nr:WD repeat-containing protein 7 [Sepia pharaonis]